MKNLVFILFCFFPLTFIGQINYPFNNKGGNDDLLAYWYNVPKDSVYLKMMDMTFPFYSTIEVYGKASTNSFVLKVEAWKENSKLFDEQFAFQDKKTDKPCQLSYNDGFFKLVHPVEYVDNKPDRIILTIKDEKGERRKEVTCTYHKLYGRIYDFEGNPLRAFVTVRPDDFNFNTSIWSDSTGYYEIELPERTYNDLAVVNENYGIDVAEAWAWHILLDENQKMDFKIGTGEVYNLNVWPNNGGGNTYFVSFRPMSLHFFKQQDKLNTIDVNGRTFKVPNMIRLNPEDVKILVNGKESRIISMQNYYETHDYENASAAYLLQVDKSGFKKAGKQSLLIEFNAREDVDGNELIYTGQGFFQFYTNFAGLSVY